MLGDLSVENALGPFVVEMHVPGIRQEKWRTGQAHEHDQPEQENSGKEIVAGREDVLPPRFETLHGWQTSKRRAPSGDTPGWPATGRTLGSLVQAVSSVLEILKNGPVGINGASHKGTSTIVSRSAVKQTIDKREQIAC